jgi:hypothetical protein
VIWRYRKQANDNLANFNPMAFSWLLTLQILAFLVWGLKTLAGFILYDPLLVNDIANLVLVAVVYLIATMQWRNPQFFTISNLAEARHAEASEAEKDAQKSVEGDLDPDIRAALYETISNRVENGELYLDGDLSLSRLAMSTVSVSCATGSPPSPNGRFWTSHLKRGSPPKAPSMPSSNSSPARPRRNIAEG